MSLTDEQIDSIRVSVRAAYLHGLLGDESRAFYEADFDAWLAAVEARAYRRALADARAAIACEDTVEWARRAAGSVISLPAVMEILDDLEATDD